MLAAVLLSHPFCLRILTRISNAGGAHYPVSAGNSLYLLVCGFLALIVALTSVMALASGDEVIELGKDCLRIGSRQPLDMLFAVEGRTPLNGGSIISTKSIVSVRRAKASSTPATLLAVRSDAESMRGSEDRRTDGLVISTTGGRQTVVASGISEAGLERLSEFLRDDCGLGDVVQVSDQQ
ncbi:MAG: hypothetical protein KGL53_11100 [Elusimicrobia bacterium]|nr:hypothetical protein [Elusimicrobiota bacterium]